MPGLPGRGPPGPGAIGAQPGPGSSPMMSPGGGAGNIANAKTLVNRAFDVLKSVLNAFPNGSREQQAVMRAMTSLNPLFGTEKAAETGQAAARQFINAGSGANPLAGSPSPGVLSAPLGPRAPMAPPPMAGGSPAGGGDDNG